MLTKEDFSYMTSCQKREWELQNSSLFKINPQASYTQCKNYSRKSIIEGIPKLKIKKGEIKEIPQGTPFHFIGRVDTSQTIISTTNYYAEYARRSFFSYTIITNKNTSRYRNDIFFIYNLCTQDIAHVFPIDSNTDSRATTAKDLTPMPSFWYTLNELVSLSYELGTYNQITVRSKRRKKIIKPVAIAAFNTIDEYTQKIADSFGIGILLLHPDTDAINYSEDLLYDWEKLDSISKTLESRYSLSVAEMYWCD